MDGDNLPKYGDKKPDFSGKRVKRGLYKTRENKLLNSDVNGPLNIIKKVISDVFSPCNKGFAV
ncbi:hypothetical protein [Okeania sp. SIO3I5]|uniref:hypothetical protein n=1 Tax=Okeania sp. SIO3I5 TaxID=2607805 RepID=UPI0025EB3B7C|nr:hypothetical protein [Okeania sp. SIO3I5]